MRLPRREPQWLKNWKGRNAEEAVAEHLRRAGYRIVQRNWRHRIGEIDLIAARDDVLVFVEVKARRDESFGSGAEAVSATKRKRLAGLAQLYLRSLREQPQACRFDIAEVGLDAAGFVRSIRLIENAFSGE